MQTGMFLHLLIHSFLPDFADQRGPDQRKSAKSAGKEFLESQKMKIYSLSRKQTLPISPAQAWEFFSSPKNLVKITPNNLTFNILYASGEEKMYAGKIITYRIKVLPFYTVTWVTEITHVHEPYYFVDDQRYGPYAFWHHQHHFKQIDGGVEMTDEINYAIPFGFLGRLANWLFVARQVNTIFDYRFQVLEKHFNPSDTSSHLN